MGGLESKRGRLKLFYIVRLVERSSPYNGLIEPRHLIGRQTPYASDQSLPVHLHQQVASHRGPVLNAHLNVYDQLSVYTEDLAVDRCTGDCLQGAVFRAKRRPTTT